MARVNVYLPDDLATEARNAGLNVSSITQNALRRALRNRRTEAWLNDLSRLPTTGVDHEQVIRAIAEARDEFGRSSG